MIFKAPREGHAVVVEKALPATLFPHPAPLFGPQPWPPNHPPPHLNHQTRHVNYKWVVTTDHMLNVSYNTAHLTQERGVGGP